LVDYTITRTEDKVCGFLVGHLLLMADNQDGAYHQKREERQLPQQAFFLFSLHIRYL
jgi:hypothetical protein